MFEFTPDDKVSDDLPVLQIIPLRYTTTDDCIIREVLEVTFSDVVSEVRYKELKGRARALSPEGPPCCIPPSQTHRPEALPPVVSW